MIQGIYLIKNNLNNKKYIGQSINIEQRWDNHKKYYNDKSHSQGCPLLYAAFNKYGVNNFTFSIIEKVDTPELLDEREEYWILYYNTLQPNGYNIYLPTKVMRGEENPNCHLTLNEVKEIKELLSTTNKTIYEIADNYNIHFSTIYRINRGEIWTVSTENYPIRKSNNEARPGSKNGRAKLSEEEVLKIRQRYINENVQEIYQDYKDLYSLSGFKKIVQGTTFKNVPIYSKIMKKWL